MTHFPYIGSGPYCYANSFAMMFGDQAPSTTIIEFATGSPFGMQLVGGTLPFFDPYGWTPEAGFDDALAVLGWTSQTVRSQTTGDALTALREALASGPVWVGPVELGHLRHQPGMKGPIGADHYLVVLGIRSDHIIMHDPQGYPYATLPVSDFMRAWQTETLGYGSPFTMRFDFRRVETVPADEVIRRSVPLAVRWLSMTGNHQVPPATLGNGEAARRLAEMIEAGTHPELRGHLTHFAVRVGARRAADAATCLARIGLQEAAEIKDRQARLIGALQYPLVVGDDATAADCLRMLAPTYEKLEAALNDQP